MEESNPSHGSPSLSHSYNSLEFVSDRTPKSERSRSSDSEESSPSPSPSHSYNSLEFVSDRTPNSERSRSSDTHRAAKIYTSSEEKGYNSVNDEEVTSYNSNQPPSLKRPKRTHIIVDQTLDLISALPDSVLLHILSFLPTKYAVTTGILSKRWQHLWTSVPNLVFRRSGSWNGGIRQFVSFVNRTLLLYGCSNVRKFYIDFEYQKCFESRVNCWVRFATRHNVEELDLHFDGEYYTLPQFIYSYSLLKRLNLRLCEVVPNGVIDWRLLKNLSISHARLSNDLIEKILSGSPVLECLELVECGGISRLDVKSASLRKLVINGYWDPPDLNDNVPLAISAPNIQSLGILGFLYRKKCRVRNVSSLVEITLNFRLLTVFEDENDHNDYEEYRYMLRAILENLHHVKQFTIGTWCIQVLSICKMKALPSPLSKCNYLKLDTYLNCWDLPGIASLLHSSPDLETLIINMNSPDNMEFELDTDILSLNDIDGRQYWTSQEMNFRDSFVNLRTLKIFGFVAHYSLTDPVVPLLQFLLKNASALERMIIYPQYTRVSRWPRLLYACTEDFLIVGQSLLSFPRSSPHTEIIFNDILNFD